MKVESLGLETKGKVLGLSVLYKILELVSVSSPSKNQHPLFLGLVLDLVVNFHKSNFSVSVLPQEIAHVPPW